MLARALTSGAEIEPASDSPIAVGD
jgi:hypothetical protein